MDYDVIAPFRNRSNGELVSGGTFTPPDEATAQRLVRAGCLRERTASDRLADLAQSPPVTAAETFAAVEKIAETGKRSRKKKAK